MNIKNFLNSYAEKILLTTYIIFLVSLSLEWEINLFRTILLVAFVSYGFNNRLVVQEILASNFMRIAFLLVGIGIISWILSPYHAKGLKTLDWIMYIIFGLSTTLIWKKNSIFLLLIIPLTCLSASALTVIWSYINSLGASYIFTGENRLFLFMETTNRLGLLCAIATSICIGISFLQKRWTIPLAFLAFCLSYINWLTQSRSSVFAIFGVMLISIAYAFNQHKRSPATISLLGLFITLLVVGVFFAKGRILSTLTSSDLAYLLNGRDDIWLAAWEIFQKSPLLGFGVNSFHDALGAHMALPENAGRFPAIRAQYTFWNAHQMILGILCDTGIAGLAVFGILIFKGIRSAVTNLPATLPALLMLATFLIHGIGGYGFHRSWNAALFFLPLGMLEGWRILAVKHNGSKEPSL